MFRARSVASAAVLLSLLLLLLVALEGCASADEDEALMPRPKPGRYVADLHGGQRGRYVPDNSGKYQHRHLPYDGGYGDRGVPYTNDVRGYARSGATPGAFALGPKDHLRFMIDFNYNGTGWQIIQFDWVRDDDDQQQQRYKYSNENMLWDANAPEADDHAYSYEQPAADAAAEQDQYFEPEDEASQVHVEGAYDQAKNGYDINYSNAPGGKRVEQNSDIQATIYEVLEYIQNHILPTLSSEPNS